MPSEFLTPAIVTVLDMLTTYLLHSTLLLTFAAVVTWCCRRPSYTLTEWLWKSAAVIPLLTVPLQLLCGVGNSVFSPRWNEPAVEVAVPEPSNIFVPENIPVVDVKPTHTPLDVGGEPLRAEIDLTSMTPSSSREPVTDPARPLSIQDSATKQIERTPLPDTSTTNVALPIPTVTPLVTKPTSMITASILPWFAKWLAGFVVVIVTAGSFRFFIVGQRFRRKVQKFRTINAGDVYGILTNLVRRAALRRRVRLLEADDVSEPIAFGIWCWTIVVPRGIESRLDRKELEALLAHELAHLVRGDAWWLLAGRLLCGCLPFQPLNFLARKHWKQAAEFQCDDWAATRTGNPLSLAHGLTRVAEWRLNVAGCAQALSAGGSGSTLSRRVERLLTDRPAVDLWERVRRRRLLTAFLLMVAIVLCWQGPRTTLLARFSEQHDKLTLKEAAALEYDDSSLSDEINSLNTDLQQLEVDFRKVEILLRKNESPSEIRALSERLSLRLADLRLHRRELLTRANPAFKIPVNAPNTKTQPTTLTAESSR
ncbi:M56 family metallopeptidase [Gimesia algae]|uniref:Heat shock protein HtpX n=1 Tax=Gimesia algae TaxID=2527971 RepID=A0A517V738_9PLAN|nr:M56 family metallopeptidase [Gimesia algae]QDT88821.1 heat shock protein HtpX [Gimesia algae]